MMYRKIVMLSAAKHLFLRTTERFFPRKVPILRDDFGLWVDIFTRGVRDSG